MIRSSQRASPRVWLLILLAAVPLGCGGGEADREERHTREQLRQARERAEQERRRTQELREQDRRVLDTQRKEAESDSSAAVLLWVATAISLVVVIVLLARERRLRQILERLVRRLLGHKQERAP